MTRKQHIEEKSINYVAASFPFRHQTLNLSEMKSAGIPYVDGYHAGEIEALKFSEWAGYHFIRLQGFWVSKFKDQREMSNWLTTAQLYDQWWKMKSQPVPETIFENVKSD